MELKSKEPVPGSKYAKHTLGERQDSIKRTIKVLKKAMGENLKL